MTRLHRQVRDGDGQVLADLTTAAGGELAAAQLDAGFARVHVSGRWPFQRLDRDTKAQAAARGKKAGVWGLCRGDFNGPA